MASEPPFRDTEEKSTSDVEQKSRFICAVEVSRGPQATQSEIYTQPDGGAVSFVGTPPPLLQVDDVAKINSRTKRELCDVKTT